MNALDFRPEMGLRHHVRTLARKFGLGPTLAALLREALQGPGTAGDLARLDRLSDRLRDDIGLPPGPAKATSFAELRAIRWPL